MVLSPGETMSDIGGLREAITAAFLSQGITGEYSEAWMQAHDPSAPREPGLPGLPYWVTSRDPAVWQARMAQLTSAVICAG